MSHFTSKLYFKLDLSSVTIDRSANQLTVKGKCTIEAPVKMGDVFAIQLVKDELILTKQP